MVRAYIPDPDKLEDTAVQMESYVSVSSSGVALGFASPRGATPLTLYFSYEEAQQIGSRLQHIAQVAAHLAKKGEAGGQ